MHRTIDLGERIVRVEEELKTQRDLIREGFAETARRFEEQTAFFNTRFEEQNANFNKRFEEQTAFFNTRFEEQNANFNQRFEEQTAFSIGGLKSRTNFNSGFRISSGLKSRRQRQQAI